MSQLFSCSKCNKQFSVERSCLEHVKICKEGPKAFHPKEPFSFITQNVKPFSCEDCKEAFTSKQDLITHKIYCSSILCSKCNVLFCSQDSLKLHFNSCEGPEMEILAEKLQITTMDKFSCSKCDMDFDLEKSLEEHSENCEIAMLEPGEEHLDHTYSKGFLTATSAKVTNLLSSDQGDLFRGIINWCGYISRSVVQRKSPLGSMF